MIQYRTLGKSGFKVSSIGLGCWGIGGPSWDDRGNPVGWSGANDQDSITGLMKAHELGINHWDTADTYGRGHSERLIGQAFQHGVKREDIVLASKVGWIKGTAEHAYERQHIRHQLEQSLVNLKTDYLDIYYLHHPFFGDDDDYLEEAAEEMHRLQKEGKFRIIGQSAYSYDQFLRVYPLVKPQVLQLPFNAIRSPFDKAENNIFRWADENQLGVVMFGTYAMGLLLGKYDMNKPPTFDEGDIRSARDTFSADFFKQLGPALDRLKQRFGENLQSLARVANQYALARSPNAVAIPGFKNSRQVESNFKTMEEPLTGEEIAFIAEIFEAFKES